MSTAKNHVCAICGHDINPNDVDVIEHGTLWVEGRPHHRLCFENELRRLRKRISELEAALSRIVKHWDMWDRGPSVGYSEREEAIKHARALLK